MQASPLNIDAAIDAHGNTALHMATIQGDYMLTAMLILKGATPLSKNASGISSYEIAHTLSHISIVHLFAVHGYRSYRKQVIVKKRRPSRIEMLEHSNLPPNPYIFPRDSIETSSAALLGFSYLNTLRQYTPIRSASGQTPLMKAAFKNHHQLVASLIKINNVDDVDNQGVSALHWAVIENALESARLLLGASTTNLEIKIYAHYTPLIIASFNGNLDMIKMLVEFGATVCMENSVNAMSLACWNLNNDAVEYFVSTHMSTITEKDYLRGVTKILCDEIEPAVEIITQTLTGYNHASFTYILSLIRGDETAAKPLLIQSIFYGHTIKLQEYLSDQSALVHELSPRVFTYGTLLSAPLQLVITQSFKMINATNNSHKDMYMQITGNLLYYLSDLISLVLSFEHSAPQDNTCESHRVIYPALFKQIAELVKECTDLSKKLILNTRLAMGVWPSAKSVSEIKVICGTIARRAVDLVQMMHATGYLPLLPTPIDPLLDDLIDPPVIIAALSNQEPGPESPSLEDTRLLTFQDYKKRHEQQVVKEVARLASLPALTTAQDDYDLQSRTQLASFHKILNGNILPIVLSMRDLKEAVAVYNREVYVMHASTILARTEYLLTDIEQYTPFQEGVEQTLFEEEDLEAFEVEGEENPIRRDGLPYLFVPILQGSIKKLRKSAQSIINLAMNAAPPWVPSSAASGIIKAVILCCMEIKFVVNLVIQMSAKILKDSGEEMRMREMWRKRCLQSSQVKNMFKLWHTQLKMGETAEFTSKTDLELLKDSEEGLVFETLVGQKVRSVKGGKLVKLIELMTSAVNQDPALNACLLMSHHSYSTSLELFDSLLKRYDITPPFGLNQANFDAFVQRKVLPIKVNVCTIIQQWVEQFFREDYHSNPALVKRLLAFIEEKLMVDFDKIAETLYTLSNAQIKAANNHPVIQSTAIHDFLDTDPRLLAKQLTEIEHGLFSRIKVYECSDQIWGDKRKKELSKIEGGVYDSSNVGMTAMIAHTNRLTMWVASKMLVGDSAKTRVACIKYFTQVAAMCKELNNYNAITAISAAISVAPIGRLYKTWARTMPKVREELTLLCDLVSPKGQYANYRKVLKELKPPAIPFLGVYLTDLTFLELGNSDFLPDSSYINVDKRRKVYMIVKEIERFQMTGYVFDDDQAIQAMPQYWEQGAIDENAMYDRSLVVEPRKEEDDDE